MIKNRKYTPDYIIVALPAMKMKKKSWTQLNWETHIVFEGEMMINSWLLSEGNGVRGIMECSWKKKTWQFTLLWPSEIYFEDEIGHLLDNLLPAGRHSNKQLGRYWGRGAMISDENSETHGRMKSHSMGKIWACFMGSQNSINNDNVLLGL